jgi:NitT/TauT family transport system substrate-binding protein
MATRKVLSAISIFLASVIAVALVTVAPARAQLQTLRIAIPQKGLFDTTMPTWIADKKGFLKDAGIKAEIFWSSGGAETVRVVTAGSADIGLATGTESVITAFLKGAPVRIISSEMTGSPDLFWLVRGDSPYKTLRDLDGKSIGFSRPGSSTHMVLQLAAEQFKIKPNLVPVGAPPDSYTALMTKQIEAGWASPPTFLDKVEKGEVRIVFRGAELEGVRGVSTRVNFTSADFYDKNQKLVRAYLSAIKKTVDWMYDNPKETVTFFAEVNQVAPSLADAGFKFFPKEALALAPVSRVDFSVDLAMKLKMIDKPPTAAELKKLIVAE